MDIGVQGWASWRREVRSDVSYYAQALAEIHHAQFGQLAERAAATVLERLRAAGISRGTVLDLGCGSGVLCRHMVDEGFDAWGVDISPGMLAIARRLVPEATLVEASVYDDDVELPEAVAICAVGEVLNYADDDRAGLGALERLVARAQAALRPGGAFVLDVATPGRAGPSGRRDVFFEGDEAYAMFVHAEESEDQRSLTRRITLFSQADGGLYEKALETHLLRLYPREQVDACLAAQPFDVERLSGYGSIRFVPGWVGWCATARGR